MCVSVCVCVCVCVCDGFVQVWGVVVKTLELLVLVNTLVDHV